MPFSYSVAADESPLRLDAFLSRAAGQSRVFVQAQIEAGRVYVNGALATKTSQKVRPGDVVSGELVEEQTESSLEPIPGELAILYEDAALLVLNKAQGMVVHPAAGHRGATLVHHLLHHFRASADFRELSPSRPGIVHRLDRGTSGLILIAKTRVAQENLSRQFKTRTIKKEYEAVVWGKPPREGLFRSVIGRDRTNRKKMSSRTDKGRESLTKYRVQTAYAHFAHVDLFPHTGRTHQLRVHLAEAHFPIVGDTLYGGTISPKRTERLPERVRGVLNEASETFLHARALTLEHPMTRLPLQFTAPRPENFERFLQVLKEEDG